ncbi:hypothetical protein D3C78_1307910 [compost metagenome]
MCGFGHGVAVEAEQAVDLIQQVPAPGGQAGHILEHDQRHRVVLPSLAHQPDAAQRQLVQGLVLRREAHLLGEQAGSTLAGTGDEHGIRALAPGGAAHIIGCGFAPARWRLLAVEADVLVAGEQIQQRAGHTCQALEIAQAGRVDIDAAEAFPMPFDVADARPSAVETLGAAAQAAAEVEVLEGALDHS